jgi:hypothetical protein
MLVRIVIISDNESLAVFKNQQADPKSLQLAPEPAPSRLA